MRARPHRLTLWLLAACLLALGLAGSVQASPLGDDGGAEWVREQPEPPEPPPGIEKPAWQVGLGKVGDIEFYSPNRGALITAGNGSTVPPGVWLYNGLRWRELSIECGATDGRIAWAGPDEFWTVSDGRTGQAANANGQLPSLEDDTLCRFKAEPPTHPKFEIVGSYATLGFLTTSYLAMHGAACLSANDCWFGGQPLIAPALGAFQLHWNGRNVISEPYDQEGHEVAAMVPFEGDVYESLLLSKSDRDLIESTEVPPLRRIVGEGEPPVYETKLEPPIYGPRESPYSLDSLRLGADAEALWVAAGPKPSGNEVGESAGVTIARYSKTQYVPVLGEYITEETPSWDTLIGPESHPDGIERFGETEAVTSIAAEPGTNAAWIALDEALDEEKPNATAPARVARIEGDGQIGDELQLPENAKPLGPTGAASLLSCPAAHDCWMVTSQGWLFHLHVAGEAVEGPADSAFAEEPGETPITYRPPDESTPQTVLDTLPEDDSGAKEGEEQESFAKITKVEVEPFARVTLPLLTHVHSRLIHGTTLDLSFHLAVKARVQLLAKRRKRVVAKTAEETLKAGNRQLLLKLNAKQWPTSLDLKTHNLAPLPTVSTRESNSNTDTVGTSERKPIEVALGPGGLLR